jgi:Tfp pilus assembly protein PilO
MSADLHRHRDVRFGWLVAGTLAVLGYVAVIAPSERRLNAIEFQAHELYQLANRNEAMYAARGSLEEARSRVERDMSLLGVKNTSSKVMFATLRLVQWESVAHHAAVTGITPIDATPPNDDGRQDVIVAIRGRYRDIVALVADLSRHDLLIDVHDLELTSTSIPIFGADVDATIHATVYHSNQGLMREENHAVR